MKSLLLIGCLLFSILMLWGSHPYVFGSGVLVSSVLVGLLLSFTESVLLGCLMILVFSSGVMVVFLFSSALCSNPKFKSLGEGKESKVKSSSGSKWGYMWSLTVVLILFFVLFGEYVESGTFAMLDVGVLEGEYFWNKEPSFNNLLGDLIIFLAFLLLFTVVVVVNLSSFTSGALVGSDSLG
uniref:NADH dehydrogenase subunit 6 n=1 Tax=Hiatella sp. J YW-2023 TaxID=3074278 RepID=A0AA51UI21_9BIVA|nr:NADH dehydrogenase subunit 6 [Hiatella sp. J YW-2023]